MLKIENRHNDSASSFLKAIMILFTVFFSAGPAAAKGFDFSVWDRILNGYVSSKSIRGISLNAVDYKALKKASQFKELLGKLENADLSNLKTREERLAFWINAYNIFAVKIILDHYPVESIKDIGSLFKSVWKRPVGSIAGVERTLNDIEHEILRKMGEPRIHVAIVCASVSCPNLAKSAYSPGKLNEQLDRQMKEFVSNHSKGFKLDRKEKRVYISPIFKWFSEDFEVKGGVIPFISGYLSNEERKLVNRSDIKVSYFDYDWGLNER